MDPSLQPNSNEDSTPHPPCRLKLSSLSLSVFSGPCWPSLLTHHAHVRIRLRVRVCVRAGCMTGLVRYLDNPTVEVASMAARTIWLLSTCPGNRPALLAQAGLFDRLVRVYRIPYHDWYQCRGWALLECSAGCCVSWPLSRTWGPTSSPAPS